MRNPIRLSAIMELPALYIFTHDSIGVGEDGPTHQPVEQLAGLRAVPGLITLRPVRCQRSGRGLARHSEAQAPARLPHSEPPAAADAGSKPVRRRPPVSRAAPMCWQISAARTAQDHLDRARAARSRSASRRPSSSRRAASQRASSACPPGSCSSSRTRPTASRCCPDAIAARVAVEQAATIGWERYVGRHGADRGHAHIRRLGSAQRAAYEIRLYA